MQFQRVALPRPFVALCEECGHHHNMSLRAPDIPLAWADWSHKHRGHAGVSLQQDLPEWAEAFTENADIKQAFGSSGTLTLSGASLASDTNLLAGRESTVFDNSSVLYPDILQSAKVSAGTGPTASRKIEIWAHAAMTDAPAYVDALTGSDANASMTSRDIANAALVLLAVLGTDSTSNRAYYMRPTSIAQAFGGVVPHKWGLWIVHNMAVALNSTSGNHTFPYKPVYYTSI